MKKVNYYMKDKKVKLLDKKWLNFAEQDLKAARELFENYNQIVCFHCQQSAEKYIKGLLILLQKDFKKTHNLNYLLDLIEKDIPDKVNEAAEYLNEYAVEARYPGEFDEIDSDETQKALKYAESIKSFIKKQADKCINKSEKHNKENNSNH